MTRATIAGDLTASRIVDPTGAEIVRRREQYAAIMLGRIKHNVEMLLTLRRGADEQT
jgi:hypothetical protein